PMTLRQAAIYLHMSLRQVHRLREQAPIRDCRRFGKEGTVGTFVRSEVRSSVSGWSGARTWPCCSRFSGTRASRPRSGTRGSEMRR
ncbi:MAG: hypothetical protein ACRDL7_04915, partial [Gaiellaceae bacterium]